MDKTDSRWIKVPEAAELLGVPRSRMYDLVARGRVPGAVRIGEKSVRINYAEFERLLLKDHSITR